MSINHPAAGQNLAGFLLLDSENVALIVHHINKPNEVHTCDSCENTAIYKVHEPEAVQPTMFSVACQDCLDVSRLDERSPDTWFAPDQKS